MPRSNRPRRRGRPTSGEDVAPLDLDRALGGAPRTERDAGGDWLVRPVAGAASGKAYRCPGCDHEIPARVAHVVAWPASGITGPDAALSDRRHWHRACWDARGRRRPTR